MNVSIPLHIARIDSDSLSFAALEFSSKTSHGQTSKLDIDQHLNKAPLLDQSAFRNMSMSSTKPRCSGGSTSDGLSEEEAKEKSELETIPKPAEAQEFMIMETKKVKKFFGTRLLMLQQSACKRLAKIWIKGICPRKQAIWPYQNNHRLRIQGMQPEKPPFWPKNGWCEFKEPDHITRKGTLMDVYLHGAEY
jgi:hypothetical protein